MKIVRALARLLLYGYPSSFRSEHGGAFLEAAEDRWQRERRSRKSGATIRTLRLLAADTLRACPQAWFSEAPGTSISQRWLAGAGTDARLAVRTIRRQPGFASLVVLTLALGIGASAAAFGAVDRAVLRPLPFADSGRYYLISMRLQQGFRTFPGREAVALWRDRAAAIERIEFFSQDRKVLTGDGPARLFRMTAFSPGLPAMLGVTPLAGRMLNAADRPGGASPGVMLSEPYWRSAYGGDPEAMGRTLRLDGTTFTIVGVWPAWARFDHSGMPAAFRVFDPGGESGSVLARLAEEAHPTAVEAELASIVSGLEEGIPRGSVPVLIPPEGARSAVYVRSLWLVFAGATALLIVALVNAANLLVGRTLTRQHELGVRMALGGSLRRLVRLFLVESVLLASVGVSGGVVVARVVVQILAVSAPVGPVGPSDDFAFQASAVWFAGAAAGFAVLVCTALPLAHARRRAVGAALTSATHRGATGRASRVRAALVGLQAAFAVLLLTGAALMTRSLVALSNVDPGFDVDRLAVLEMYATGERYATEEARARLFERAGEAFRTIPGVEAVTWSSGDLFRSSVQLGLPFLDGEPVPDSPTGSFASTISVIPNYFQTAGVPLLEGRLFAPGDSGVVVVNRTLAQRHGGRVVGRSIHLRPGADPLRIIGVVGDVRAAGLSDDDHLLQVYFPRDRPYAGNYFQYLLRTSGSPAAISQAARARLDEIDPTVPFVQAVTGADLFAAETARHRFVALLLAMLAALGVVFAVAGVYGVLSLEVNRRRREVGVRLALGATTGRVVVDVIRGGLKPVLAGALGGGAASIWAGPYIESLLFRVGPRDPWSLAAGLAIPLLAALAACLVPARRARAVNPIEVLRAE
jgi:predicted permease